RRLKALCAEQSKLKEETMVRYRLKLLLGAAFCAAGYGTVSAQPAPSSVEPQAIQEVVVTAQKKSETVQKAAISITAIAPQKLESMGIKDLYDAQTLLPGVRFQESDTTVPVIRGVGTFATNVGVDPAVAYSIDGVYLSHYQAIPPVLFDANRIEV